MLRKTLTILSLIGLLLSVGLWGASYYAIAAWVSGKGSFRAFISYGCLEVDYVLSNSIIPGGPSNFRGPSRVALRRFPNFRTQWLPSSDVNSMYRQPNSAKRRRVVLPMSMTALGFGIVLCLCRPLQDRRRRKRKKLGLCLRCGYDLRASKDRCPECGQEFETAMNS